MGFMKNIELELIEENISWDDIYSLDMASPINKFDAFCKSLDDIPEQEQTEFIADIILNSFLN